MNYNNFNMRTAFCIGKKDMELKRKKKSSFKYFILNLDLNVASELTVILLREQNQSN